MNDFTPMALADFLDRSVTFPRLTCAELASGDYATKYLVEGILVESQPCIIGGPKKALKTSMLIDLAIATATGGHFLGRFNVPRPRRVAVMSGESGLGLKQAYSQAL